MLRVLREWPIRCAAACHECQLATRPQCAAWFGGQSHPVSAPCSTTAQHVPRMCSAYLLPTCFQLLDCTAGSCCGHCAATGTRKPRRCATMNFNQSLHPEHTKHHPFPFCRPCRAGPSHFKVTLDDGTQLEARRVVVAIGSTNLPRVPCWAQHLTPAKQQPGMLPRGFVLHSWDVARAFYSRAQSSIKPNYEQAQAHNTSLKRAARSRPSKATPPLVLSRCADGVCAHSGSLGLCGVATLPLQMPSSGRAVDSSNKGNAINSCLDCGDTRCVGECDTERVPEPPGWIDATGLEALSLGGHTGITQPTASHHQPGSTDGACMMHVGASSGGESAALPPRITMPPSSICGQQAGGQAPGSAGSLGCGLTSPTSPHPETDEDFVEPCSPQPLCLSPNCASLAGTRVVVVGGGLTASQLALLAVRHGCQDCVVIVRGELKVGSKTSSNPINANPLAGRKSCFSRVPLWVCHFLSLKLSW